MSNEPSNPLSSLSELVTFSQELWPYFLYSVCVFFGIVAILLLEKGAENLLVHWLKKHKEGTASHLVERLRKPVKATLIITLLFASLGVFDLSSSSWHLQLYTLAIGVCTTVILLRFIETFLWHWKKNYKRQHNQELNAQLYLLIGKGLKLFVIVTMSLMTLRNAGLDITSLLASLSIGSLAVALAAQDTFANLFGAISILADNPFQIGDRIRVEQFEGAVESIGLRSTIMRSNEGFLVSIPNKNMGSAVIMNLSDRTAWKSTFQFSLEHQISKEKLIRVYEILKQVYSSDPLTNSAVVGFRRFEDACLRVEVEHSYQAKDHAHYVESMHRLHLIVKEALDQEEISLGGGALTVQLQDPPLALLGRASESSSPSALGKLIPKNPEKEPKRAKKESKNSVEKPSENRGLPTSEK